MNYSYSKFINITIASTTKVTNILETQKTTSLILFYYNLGYLRFFYY